MKNNNSKKFNLYIQVQRWAVRVWLILGILGSFSLHNVLGTKMSVSHNVLGTEMSVSTALKTTVCCGLLLQLGTALKTESGPRQECDLRDQPSGPGRLLLRVTADQAQAVYEGLPPEQQKRVKARIANKQKKNPYLTDPEALRLALKSLGLGLEGENSAALPSPTLNLPAALSSPKPNPVPPAALRSPKPKPVPSAVTEPTESQSGAAVLLSYQGLYLLVIALILSQAF